MKPLLFFKWKLKFLPLQMVSFCAKVNQETFFQIERRRTCRTTNQTGSFFIYYQCWWGSQSKIFKKDESLISLRKSLNA